MSVVVTHLTKSFGSQKAVDRLSFKASAGEILGFLGPNGAGKSTTMRMITGFLAADEGDIKVAGHDVSPDNLESRKLIGYLPEHNPLYTDLYVREYLGVMCGFHKVKHPAKRIGEIIELTGLTREAGKKIGQLSKGFRQRVGIAQALVHDPEVLILDEPTSGLDPNQLVEIRGLIKLLGKTKTVIFSTHIMQEVQAICDRVVIIDRGKMVLDEPIGFLSQQKSHQQRVHVQFDRRILTNTLKKVRGVADIIEQERCVYVVSGNDKEDLRPLIFGFAVEKGASIVEMYQLQNSVEDIFQQLTKGSK